ncbi:MAG: hypothetical protein QOI57_2863 [Rubrobacteraceae bacterium]|jgi:hypothetical protein|nr:hypothetical protein [Rubrobacteraceae bacterium]
MLSMIYRGPEDAGAKSGEVGRIVHFFSIHPFKGDVVVLVGESEELCSVDKVDKVESQSDPGARCSPIPPTLSTAPSSQALTI